MVDLAIHIQRSIDCNGGPTCIPGAATWALIDVTVHYSRVPPDPCYRLGIVAHGPFDVSFERLWTMDDAFGGRRSVETIDLQDVFIEDWTFPMKSGAVTEDVELLVPPPLETGGGTQTLRSFDDTTGVQSDSQPFAF